MSAGGARRSTRVSTCSFSRQCAAPDTCCVSPNRPLNAAALFRTSTFRIAVLYLVLFATSAMALLGFVYATTAGFMARQTEETIQAEITGLAEQYRRGGLVGLTRVVIERSRNQRHSLYLLVAPAGTPLAGNLDSWRSEEHTTELPSLMRISYA